MRKWMLAALLSTTCLCTPGQAKAGPISPFLQGIWVGLTTGVGAGAGIGGAFATGMSAGAWLMGGSFLSRIVVSVGLSLLSQALIPKPKMPPPPEIMANYAQDVAFVEWAYGRVRKGGPMALSAYSAAPVVNPGGSDAKGKRHYGVLIACHSTRGPVVHYLDKRQVELDAGGFVTTDPIRWPEGSHPGVWHGMVRAYTGQPGQAADPVWQAAFPEVGVSDDFAGLSYAGLYAARCATELFSQIYPNGREWAYAPVWDGCDTVYDPRTDSFGWTDNAGLIIADIATRIYAKQVSWTEVAEQADISDSTVTNRDGGTQKRWTINTVIRADMTWEQARAHLQMCCDAWFYERSDGRLGFKVGHYEEPDLILTAADFVRLTVKHKATDPDAAGSYALRYVEPARDWNEEVSGAVVVSADPTAPRAEEECFGIDSHNQAWRVIRRWAATAQPEWAISGTLKYIGRQVMGRRFVRIQHAELGLDCRCEVGMLARNGGSHTWQIQAVSVQPEDFAPNALVSEPPRTLRASLAEDGAVPAPASLSGQVVEGTGGVPLIDWTWPAQTDDLRQQLRIRSVDAGLPDWQIVDIPGGQGNLLSSGLIDGADYEAQVRNRTNAGRVSGWVPEAPVVVRAVANTDPPPAVEDFAATTAGSTVLVDWTAPNSPLYVAARIYRAVGAGAVFGDASVVRLEFGAASLPDSWTDPGPGVGDHRYWIEPINASGVGGPVSGPEDVTII